MVNSNMVNLKFHQFEVNLTVVYFEVAVIQSFNFKYVVIQTIYSTLWEVSCNLKTLY